jgi:hypothetical protein
MESTYHGNLYLLLLLLLLSKLGLGSGFEEEGVLLELEEWVDGVLGWRVGWGGGVLVWWVLKRLHI